MIPTSPTPARGWQSRWFHFALWLVILTALGSFLRAVEPILLPFVLGMFVAYLMNPLAGILEKLGLGRSAATAVILIGLLAVLTGLGVWLLPLLYDQVATLFASAPTQLHALETSIRDEAAPLLKRLNSLTGGATPGAIPSDLSQLVERGIGGASKLAGQVFSSGAALLNVVALLLISPIVCFYLLRDWPSVMRKVDELLPLTYAPTIREQLRLINRTLAGYVRGQITVMLILSAFYVVTFGLVGLHFAMLLGVLAGCIVIIPYIGSLISVGIGLLVAHGQFGTTTDFWVIIGIYGVGQILESQILTPKIIGDRVGLHPLWMLFGMLAGAAILGLVGVLIAVPLTAVIGVLVKFAVSRYLSSPLYQG